MCSFLLNGGIKMKNRYKIPILIVSLSLLINGCDISSREEIKDSNAASAADTTSVTSETTVQTPTPSPTPVPETSSSTVSDTADSDFDGLTDEVELQLGTDPQKADSDADGLEDMIELLIGYDPLSPDSDSNGTPDIEEDLDDDGLSNGDEIALGTNIFSDDSDFDGLSDGDEMNIYGTDPTDPDSDGDGVYDGAELSMGKDPCDPSDGAVSVEQTFVLEINNPEDPAITSVEVSASCSCDISDFIEVRDVYNIDFHVMGTPARVGSPIGFYGDEDPDGITVVIHYDENSLGETNEEDLVVMCWCQEDEGISHYETQEQAVLDTENNTITFELQRYGSYIVADQVAWDNIRPQSYTLS